MSQTLQTVAVIGAGTMGAGIAEVAAAAGHPVLLYDIAAEALTRAEQSLFEQHCEWSVEACRKAELSRDVLTLISQHHELCDGSGYPKKLRQQDIHPLARTLALVDQFDTLCNGLQQGVTHTPQDRKSVV